MSKKIESGEIQVHSEEIRKKIGSELEEVERSRTRAQAIEELVHGGINLEIKGKLPASLMSGLRERARSTY